MFHNGKINGKNWVILNDMGISLKVGDLCKICKSRNWRTDPFGIDGTTRKQKDLSLEEICLVLQLSPPWDTEASKLWARVLIGDTIWDVHTDFLEKFND